MPVPPPRDVCTLLTDCSRQVDRLDVAPPDDRAENVFSADYDFGVSLPSAIYKFTVKISHAAV